jgi:hypothetical protein
MVSGQAVRVTSAMYQLPVPHVHSNAQSSTTKRAMGTGIAQSKAARASAQQSAGFGQALFVTFALLVIVALRATFSARGDHVTLVTVTVCAAQA